MILQLLDLIKTCGTGLNTSLSPQAISWILDVPTSKLQQREWERHSTEGRTKCWKEPGSLNDFVRISFSSWTTRLRIAGEKEMSICLLSATVFGDFPVIAAYPCQ